jgi:hypothetical protein
MRWGGLAARSCDREKGGCGWGLGGLGVNCCGWGLGLRGLVSKYLFRLCARFGVGQIARVLKQDRFISYCKVQIVDIYDLKKKWTSSDLWLWLDSCCAASSRFRSGHVDRPTIDEELVGKHGLVVTGSFISLSLKYFQSWPLFKKKNSDILFIRHVTSVLYQ